MKGILPWLGQYLTPELGLVVRYAKGLQLPISVRRISVTTRDDESKTRSSARLL